MKTHLLIWILCIACFVNIADAQNKLNEDFTSSTFPPAGWSLGKLQGTSTMTTRGTPNAFVASGNGCIQVDFYHIFSDIDTFTTPVFPAVISGDTLYFDQAHCQYP